MKHSNFVPQFTLLEPTKWLGHGAGLMLLLLALALQIKAQVPEAIHYHGRILVGNENFNSTGEFRFALVNEDGTQTYWSNDGTSVNGSEPTDPVEINVEKGLYSVVLGDPALPNMQPIPPLVFETDQVWLRIWFDDTVHGSELFVPDQRIVSVGYSMMAANILDGAITTDKLADGAVTADKIAEGAIGGDQIADNSIGSDEIANTLTLQRLNMGGVSWDGSVHLFAKPSGGGGGIINNSGEMRGHLIGDELGSEFALRFSDAKVGAELFSRATGGTLRLWDPLGTMTAYLGTHQGGGALDLKQVNGNNGIRLDANPGSYAQGPDGGEITIHNTQGQVSLELDGSGNNLGGEILARDPQGNLTVRIDANGPDASLTGNGYLQLGQTSQPNLVLDGNEITARNGGRESALFLNPNQGNVVIGRTSELSPSVRLAVQSDANQDALRVRVDGQTKLYVAGTGQVGINTTNLATGYELSVNGQVICQELVVQNSAQWPDYVFADDYNLMSLDDLKASIQAKKHLPGIPPASDVESAGVSIGDMQIRMMEKIEELTLYILQQDERIKRQDADLEGLKARLGSLQ